MDAIFGFINAAVSKIFFFNILFFMDGAEFPLAVTWLIAGAVYFTFKLRFVNFRMFRHAIDLTRGLYDKPDAVGEVNRFKALATALSATLGLGNISGVAVAIAMGGPGATFWMIVAGLIGMSTKLAECTLAQMYREKRPDGHILGGPMLYLEKGFAEKGHRTFGRALAVTFALLCVFGAYGGGGSFQVNQSMFALAEVLPIVNDYTWVYGLVLIVLVGAVIIGGIKRIAEVAEKIVPFMCVLYIAMGLYTLGVNYALVPWALSEIVRGAFAPDAVYGGIIGVMAMGFRRASFSNEAGVGSAAIAHSTAKTEFAVQEGLVSLLEPFIDTVMLCTMTALIIVITGAYNNPAYIDIIHSHNGSALTSRALGQISPYFPYVLCLIVFLFAYSTIISWSYYGERCFVYLFGEKYSIVYKILLLVVLFCGAVTSATNIMEFGDLMILGMAFPNIIGLMFMRNKITIALAEYTSLLKTGVVRKTK